MNSKPIIIACDHGYGNMKTALAVFKTGVTAYDNEPTFKSNLLVYNGRYYLIEEEHKEFTAEKMNDQDYYILTLAAIGIELRYGNLPSMNSKRLAATMGNIFSFSPTTDSNLSAVNMTGFSNPAQK